MTTRVPFERRFDIDAVVGEQAARAGAMQDGGGGGGFAAALALRGGKAQVDFEYGAAAAGDKLALVFMDADAALFGDGGGVDAVDGVGAFGIGKDAGDGGVADEIGFALRDAPGVGDVDGFERTGARPWARKLPRRAAMSMDGPISRYSSCVSEGRLTAFCTTPSLR